MKWSFHCFTFLILACGGPAFAHSEQETLYLSLEQGQLVIRDYQGQPLSVFASDIKSELEWDERNIYKNLDANGVPLDGSGQALLIDKEGNSDPNGTPNEAFVTDDYAWNSYDHSTSLSVAPAQDGSVDNANITVTLLKPLQLWDGSSFVNSEAQLSVATWFWTNVKDDGINDENDGRYFPDDGWYAYPIDPVSPGDQPIAAGSYEFAPDDHYHWLMTLQPDAKAGIYLVELAFSSAKAKDSAPIKFLLVNGLGTDWETNQDLLAAKAFLAQ